MCQSHIIFGSIAVLIVLKDVLSLYRSFGQCHIVPYNRFEHFVTERVIDNFSYALVECLALVKLGNNNATNTQVRVQAFLDNLNYACNLQIGRASCRERV